MVVYHHRLWVFDPTQDDTVPDCLKVIPQRLLPDERQNDFNGVRPTHGHIPLTLRKNYTLRISGFKVGPTQQALDLAAKNQLGLVILNGIEREFDAGRTSIQAKKCRFGITHISDPDLV